MLRDKTPEQADLRLSPSLLRRFKGPAAVEVHLRCRPEPGEVGSVVEQTESLYRQLRDALAAEGGSLENVVRETVFFRNVAVDLEDFVKSRERILHGMGQPNNYTAASTVVEQPPLDGFTSEDDGDRAPDVEVLVTAVLPHPATSVATWRLSGETRCRCPVCSDLGARALLMGGQKHMFAGNICGAPGTPFEESLDMFQVAQGLLEKEGMDFRSVARTWIYLRDMEGDYAEFNRARRTFFQRAGIDVLPASTGIEGIPGSTDHSFVMGFYALQGSQPVVRETMTTPTLNEAPDYGSDFSRGLRVADANKVALYVSGTASVDEVGRTVHEDDFDAQVERMLLNVSSLLKRQKADYRDVVSAVTYIKNASDAPAFRRVLREQGICGFPNVVVEAGVCRTDLLCEMECIALLPREP